MRIVRALLGATAAVTLVWIMWPLLAPTGFYHIGNVVLIPLLVGALICGLAAGYLAQGRWRLLIYGAVALSACFWIFVASWWAHRP